MTADAGDPACGKTILAAATVEELCSSGENENTCYFFFKEGGRGFESHVQAYRAVLTQTMRRHRENWQLINECASVMNRSGQTQITKHELLLLLRMCAQRDFLHNLVLDGVDECDSPFELLTELSQVFDNTAVKVALFGRSSMNHF